MVLESGIFLCHALWLFRTRHLRKEAKRAGKSFDEYIVDHHHLHNDHDHDHDHHPNAQRQTSSTGPSSKLEPLPEDVNQQPSHHTTPDLEMSHA